MWTNGLQLAGAGTSFPNGPAVNDIFLRTDLQAIYQFVGAGTAGAVGFPVAGWLPLDGPPIGTIAAWHPNILNPSLPLPPCWKLCNGNAISDQESPLNSQSTPNLNSGYFLRGASTSSSTLVAANMPSHTHDLGSHTHTAGTYSMNFSNGAGGGSTVAQRLALQGLTTQGLNGSSGGPSTNTSGAPSTGSDGSGNNWPAHVDIVWIMRFK